MSLTRPASPFCPAGVLIQWWYTAGMLPSTLHCWDHAQMDTDRPAYCYLRHHLQPFSIHSISLRLPLHLVHCPGAVSFQPLEGRRGLLPASDPKQVQHVSSALRQSQQDRIYSTDIETYRHNTQWERTLRFVYEPSVMKTRCFKCSTIDTSSVTSRCSLLW